MLFMYTDSDILSVLQKTNLYKILKTHWLFIFYSKAMWTHGCLEEMQRWSQMFLRYSVSFLFPYFKTDLWYVIVYGAFTV
jgi:hypothetical protein